MSAAEYTIGRHCGITFAGLKPASLVSIEKAERGVLARLSKKFKNKGFNFVVLGGCQRKLIVYVYHAEKLKKNALFAASKEFLTFPRL